ncbi:MAG: hypothetical protein GW875_02035 [Deltaproteobacteria bacterium]|nr:hypothetical protein [Deltaproteobacteria bacterium]NCP03204.1 hypothetical protein [Deltaproteobacteria bacterium]
MKSKILTRRRMSQCCAALAVVLMVVDLLVTGSFFVHSAELMTASVGCFIAALLLDKNSRS